MNSRKFILGALPLFLICAGWYFFQDGHESVGTPLPELVREPTASLPGGTFAELDGLTRGPRYETIKGPLSEALRKGMTEEQQFDFIRKLREAGMDIGEWEQLVAMLSGNSKDPAFILKLADLVDAGSERENLLSHAFEFVAKDKLPMFTAALNSVQNDSLREFLASKAVDQLVAEGDIGSTVAWVKSVADPKREDQYCSFILNTLVQNMGSASGRKPPLVPFKDLPGYFTDRQLQDYRGIYGGYYISQGDFESLKGTIAVLSADDQSSVLGTSIGKADKITPAEAGDLLKLVPENSYNQLYILKELSKKIRATEGDEAAARFIEAHPEATTGQANP